MFSDLKTLIDDLVADYSEARKDEARNAFAQLRDSLDRGRVRAAQKTGGEWQVNEWVRQGILLGFRVGDNRDVRDTGVLQARDRDTLPLRPVELFDERSRLAPGGSSIRDGAFIGQGVICMPPMYVNIGAYVGDGTMIDSHALVGSCAQVGRRCHISAAVQLGGVLEPAGAWPVIIEDDVLVGAGSCVVEGVIVREKAIIGAGVTLTSSTPVYDLVEGRILRASNDLPLVIPSNAVVVPGSRPARGEFAKKHGLQVATPLIVKYRDRQADESLVEGALR